MNQSYWGNEYRTTLIYIDCYDGGIPAGAFYNPYYQGSIAFRGTMDLLKKLNNMMNLMRFPQEYDQLRRFAEDGEIQSVTPERMIPRYGKVATISVEVLFRQNASWQGRTAWLEGHQSVNFRSVLELLSLLDSAASAQKRKVTT